MQQFDFTFTPRLGFTFTEAELGGVFLLNHDKTPLLPITNRKARWLLNNQKAAVYRHYPFTVILNETYHGQKLAYPLEFKADPGSKVTGLALVVNIGGERKVLWAANLTHKGWLVHKSLESRAAVRRNRRQRKTRYRKKRFDRVRKKEGWLAPSLLSRVNNVANWLKKLQKFAPITDVAIETVRFDMQKMRNPEIEGVQYQQGALQGYEVREYLLEKFHRQCAYCGKKDVPLQIEHIVPRARGGTDSITNLALACQKCNEKKGAKSIEEFLSKKPALLKRIKSQLKATLKDAAAVNATRYKILEVLKESGLPVTCWSGARTKMNRVKQGYPKDHWIDAVCVGENGERVFISPDLRPLEVKAMGRGNRNVQGHDEFGFPVRHTRDPNVILRTNRLGKVIHKVIKTVKLKPSNRDANGLPIRKRIDGVFQTGDLIKMNHHSEGVVVGRATAEYSHGRLEIRQHKGKRLSAVARNCQLLQKTDGYQYATGKSLNDLLKCGVTND